MVEFFDKFQYNSSLNCLWFNNFSACVMVTNVQSNSSVGLFACRSFYLAVWVISRFLECLLKFRSVELRWLCNHVSCCIYFSVLFALYWFLLFCYLFVVFPFFDISCLFINFSPKNVCIMASDCHFKNVGW